MPSVRGILDKLIGKKREYMRCVFASVMAREVLMLSTLSTL